MKTRTLHVSKHHIRKELIVLQGIVHGILIDSEITDGEAKALTQWVESLEEFRYRAPFREVVEEIDHILADGVVTEEEAADLLWFVQRWISDDEHTDVFTRDIQHLNGIAAGLLADSELKDEEVTKLYEWLLEHDTLRGSWPYEELHAVLTAVLEDGVIDEDERTLLKAVIADCVRSSDHKVVQIEGIDLETMTVRGICASDPEIEFEGKTFCFTGRCQNGQRDKLEAMVREQGGITRSGVSRKLDYLVVGSDGNPCWAFACHGRKIEKAMRYRKEGVRLMLINEHDLVDALG